MLYGILFDVTLIDEKFTNKEIGFELTFGRSTVSLEDKQKGDEIASNQTPYIKATTENKKFSAIPYSDFKPCLKTMCNLPDFRRRMYNTNIIKKIRKGLVIREIKNFVKQFLIFNTRKRK